MGLIVLRNTSSYNDQYTAVFDPEKGMNLKSFTKNGFEALDLSTTHLFDSRAAGLGALIGPHFYHRKETDIIKIDESLFPHLPQVYAAGQKEPFSHGIARYVAWRAESSSTQIDAYLSGDMKHQGIPLKKLQGFDFEMKLHVALLPDGLLIDYSISSEKPSVIGFHYYYRSFQESYVTGKVKDFYRLKTEKLPLPNSWVDPHHKHLHFLLNQEADYGFYPIHDEETSSFVIKLKNPHNLVHLDFDASDEAESCWQLYHPKDDTFTCIEPLSASQPSLPILKFSRLQMKLNLIKI